MTAFPDTLWGSAGSVLRKPMIAFSCTKAGSWTIKALTPLDRALLRRSKGRYTMLGPIAAPVLLLNTIGRVSGQPRQTPLIYARDPDRDALFVVGSNFGNATHPAWSGNLLANPEATVTMGGRDVPVRADLLTGAEADAAFERLVAEARTYAEYRARTDRTIRVFRLVPR